MKKFLLSMGLAAIAMGACAEDAGRPAVRKLKPKKGVVLTDAQQKVLDEANVAFEKAYEFLVDKHQPGEAVKELRKAYAISKQLGALADDPPKMAGIAPGNEIGTQTEHVDSTGGIETVVEIGAEIGIRPPEELDYGLHKRQITKQKEADAKKIDAEQKSVTQQLQQMAAAGGGGGEQNPQDQQQPQPLPDANAPQQAAQNNKAEPAGKPGQQQPGPAQPGAQQQAGKPEQNGKQEPGAMPHEQTAAKQEPGAKPGEQAANQQGKPGEQNGKPGEQTANQQGRPGENNEAGKPGEQTTGGAQNGERNNQGKQDAQAAALANKQDEIARDLNKIAAQLAELNKGGANGENKAAQKFLDAAAQAANTAQLIRDKKIQDAAAASKNVERKIADAMNATGTAGAEALDQVIGELAKQIEKMQTAQNNLKNQAQQAGQGANGAPVPDSVKNERATKLALEQGKMKAQIEDLQKTVGELAAQAGEGNAGPRKPEDTAREELGKAANEMKKGKPGKAVVNATMKLGDGDLDGAAKAMTEVQNTLNAAKNRVEAAGNALLGGDEARLEKDYNKFKELAGELRRLEQTAKNAAEGKGENGGEQNAKGEPNNKGGRPGEQQAGKNDEAKNEQSGKGEQAGNGTVSATWGQVLNKSAEQIRSEMARTLPRLEKLAPDAAGGLKELNSKDPAFERDFKGSMDQVQKMLVAAEKLEAELARKLEKDQENKAMRNYIKDEIPGSYKGAVAAYYEELSKDERK